MLELLQITNDPAIALRCDAIGGIRLFVDLEHLGKAERQAGRNTYISNHQISDVGRVKAQLVRSRLMVRVNPLHQGTQSEVDAVFAQGLGQGSGRASGAAADLLMLPMFTSTETLHSFSEIVAGRCPIVALLETAGALASIDDWIATPGLAEVYVGLNDLHISLGMRFMFEPLASGIVDQVATITKQHGLRFGFGGMARLVEGLLAGRDVLAEHLRVGSQAVILSRTFHRQDTDTTFEEQIQALREAEVHMALRTQQQIEADKKFIAARIVSIASGIARPAPHASVALSSIHNPYCLGRTKRLLDMVVSSVALVAVMPLMLATALAVALESGLPVLLNQTRHGLGGRKFGMLKFRSMVKNAADLGLYYTQPRDPRITRVGRFIRRTSLDELPQLLNVLHGDMSLIGPRPDVPEQRCLYTDAEWQQRCAVRPGVTGLAQVLNRSQGSESERLVLDLRYQTQASLWFDLKILWWTVGRLSGKGSN
jgi:lipopolysaccharide/colanic/teichoic acid biosynthesis glycosyltransferase